jgi:hypothetical protein
VGTGGQVDWYEAWAELGGEQVQLQVFSMRSSGAAFHRAYHRATQQAFLEAHEHAFLYYGSQLAEQGVRARHTHLGFLEARVRTPGNQVFGRSVRFLG